MATTDTQRQCNICRDDLSSKTPGLDAIFINDVWTCRDCLNQVIQRVTEGEDQYPVKMNGKPINLEEHSTHVDRNLLRRYHNLEAELSTHPYLRIYCMCGKFLGKAITPAPVNPFQAIRQCSACKKSTCRACNKAMKWGDPNASVANHGCKERLEAVEKEHQGMLKDEDRGKNYQVCPVCRRCIQLADACYHISCHCGNHFCYKCGKQAWSSHHWGTGVMQCELYPGRATPRQVRCAQLAESNISRPPSNQPTVSAELANGQPAIEQPHHCMAGPEAPAAAEAAHERLDNIGIRPRPQTRMIVGLQASQWADPVPDPNTTNYRNQTTVQQERDLEREREEAEQAHDDALRAAERKADERKADENP